MQHSICGLHKWTTVAKDIHKSTNTLMYHKKVYDTRHIRSESFMMTHNPRKDPNTSQKSSSSRKDGDKSKPKKVVETNHHHHKRKENTPRSNDSGGAKTMTLMVRLKKLNERLQMTMIPRQRAAAAIAVAALKTKTTFLHHQYYNKNNSNTNHFV